MLKEGARSGLNFNLLLRFSEIFLFNEEENDFFNSQSYMWNFCRISLPQRGLFLRHKATAEISVTLTHTESVDQTESMLCRSQR